MAKYRVPIYVRFQLETIEVEARNPIEALKAVPPFDKYKAMPKEDVLALIHEGSATAEFGRGKAEKVI